MQNYCKTIGALAAASALVAGNASAEVEYEIHTGYTSDYLFRGTNLGNDLVEVGVDVATEWNGLGVSAGAWYGSFANGPIDQDFDELDIYGEVSKDLGLATLAVGYIGYQNERLLGDDAKEVYFSVSKEFYGIDTSFTYFWDVETDNNGYSELSFGKGFELSPCLTLSTGLTVAYLWEESEFAHLTAKVSLDWAFTETATLSPFVAAALSLDDNYNGGDDELVAGTMLSVSF